jgi:hypothetical protein
MESQPEVQRSFKWWFIGALGLLALIASILGMAARERGWGEYLRLIQDGTSCEATITRVEPRAPCLAQYTFSHGGRDYSGAGPDCRAKVGQKVVITYLVADPSRSCLGRAGERLADDVASFLFGGLKFPELS